MNAAEPCVPTSGAECEALSEGQRKQVWETVHKEMIARQPNEHDLQNIQELYGLGWKGTAIASALELKVGTVRKVTKGWPKPVKETVQQRLDRELQGRILISGGEQI